MAVRLTCFLMVRLKGRPQNHTSELHQNYIFEIVMDHSMGRGIKWQGLRLTELQYIDEIIKESSEPFAILVQPPHSPN